jgi:aryl-alcohol dehydrogenase-like predicted oxidoreductase
MEAMLRLKEQGKIRAAGVCNYTIAQMNEAEKTISLASDQVPYSMVNRDVEKDIIPYALQHGKAVFAYSPLQRGLLTGKIKPELRFNERDTRDGNVFFSLPNIIEVNTFLDKLKPLTESKKATLAQLVIRWTIDQPGITLALVGARNAKQAIENAGADNIRLSAGEMKFINDELGKLTLVR